MGNCTKWPATIRTTSAAWSIDGDALIAEYAPDGTMLDRYLHGPSGSDDPLIWYQDSSVSSNKEHCLHAASSASIVATSKRDTPAHQTQPHTHSP